MSKATSVKDVPAQKFIAALALHFKKSGKYELPVWHDIVKTTCAKQLAPADEDWYYVRLAAIIRQIYIQKNLTIKDLANHFGHGAKFDTRPRHFVRAATGIIRTALKALENTKLVGKKEGVKGHVLTAAGRRELDIIASTL